MKPLPPSVNSQGFPDGNGLPKPVSIINSADDRCMVNAEGVNNAHGRQTVDANAGLFIDLKDFLLTVDLVGTVADCVVVIDKEAVQACSEHEDVTRLGNV